jgi:hypothetical protein
VIVPGYDELRLEALFVELDASGLADATVSAWAALLRVEPSVKREGVEGAWTQGLAAEDPLRSGRFGVELVAPSSGRISPDRAWQIAHSVQMLLANGRVEPTFAHPEVAAPTPASQLRAAFDEGSHAVDGPPPEDVGWHLELIGAKEALAWLERQPDVAADDVLIGHPDTGYTKHPDIFGPGAPIPQAAGHDFLSGDDDATDPLDAGAFLQPGHGTATASVLCARPGNEIPRVGGSALADLQGVAPSAKIMPLRVTRSVIVLGWQRRLAEAIEHAVARGCRVISMSVGGLGGRRLERAVAEAEKQGVIVVAAAGNQVGFVVAPASYPTVVACAAVGPDRKPWPGSSRGRTVDISAPGHQVWVATWEGSTAAARAASGTSFATACVAGAAVLWLRAHAAKLAAHPQRAALLFRRALAQTARPFALPDGFGAGLLDCAALVRCFPELGASEAAPARVLGAQEATLDALIETPAGRELGRKLEPGAAAELAFHLTVDRELREQWRRQGPHAALASEAAGDAAPAPAHASARLRSALRRARVGSSADSVTAIASSSPSPPPSTSLSTKPMVPNSDLPSRAMSAGAPTTADASMTTVARINIVLELRVRVLTEEDGS